ncbi:L-rhamnose mutarotase [Dysgonomonas hofstadii]|uniref:L-rhamnose mutarotase n=1 Tax=Dysgonomonas hofstadii TaxID=637886 RepID=A0A840CL23_9BACT|nr:L-rhamnose mutarotase [Dysgonomonas hofstadii]MBB4035851.1 L-rhamnose mutarotase [Dysgonomonas hofstadii]
MNRNLKEGYITPAGATKRFCQVITLNTETLEDYKFWHGSKNIWKEIPQGIRKAGILDMEIYMISNQAFMIIETPLDFDWDEAFGRLATYERQAEWEEFVSKFQVAGSGKRSEEKWQLIERIFSLSEALEEK